MTMPYRICKTIEIETGHMLSKHHGNCKYPHGHSRLVELVLEADELDQNDMVCDYGVIKSVLKEFLDTLDHAMCINTDDPMYQTLMSAYSARIIPFEHKDPTSEVIAKMIYDRFQSDLSKYAQLKAPALPLSDKVRLLRVRVWETSTSWAEYEK
jgi:6-pyruvoyltetrahydropterin/6-carboxytetrahydropterin synthase